jgi:uncharacterized protein YkwD
MQTVPRLLLSFVVGAGIAVIQPASPLTASSVSRAETAGQSAPGAKLKPAAANADLPFNDGEWQTEQQLLQLANQSRRQAGAPPLRLDPGLSQAARIHAQAMLKAEQLSHQFAGEPSLPQRLADMTGLELDQEGENVALDYDAEHGHQHLMLSPPHRANLLNPDYNVVGLGVVRSGDRLYIVQDFGHALPHYSADEVKDRVAIALNHLRQRHRRSDLERSDLLNADDAACSMAHADKLGTSPVRKLAESSTVLTYTSLRPDTLPAAAIRAIGSRNLHTFSIGACYGKTETYPTGVYWIVVSLR